ncbi:MAG: DUF169 domain-containing protein [Anaerolineales bacterium]|nr:DUF169 domain-containing protein [Anaerolineales bacterium]MCB8960988.1 DUF169 domain-containing protein [Ardenticatenales bacterium]MCB0004812.1 DUF169 domain-containing protein [Anaerolineales bacterium]MCB0010481.1 DUF169 domain-containing protein [Anaerolineales bacterium]MCB0017641.1 DUF169 domain-containing protein [Anaerolineales bacterium]
MSETVDLNYLNDILVNKMRVKRQPVAITYVQDGPPAGYEPVDVVACMIVRLAENGRLIYVDRQHHDCYVGQYHLGWNPEPGEFISEGHYLTMAQGFFTPEGAKCNKAQSYSLPEGSLTALAAAPLDKVPAGTQVDLIVCICNAQQAMQIAGAASVREGTFPHGELGASACSSIFAAPWHTKNSVFALGDGGGRAFNQVASGEMFVSIPRHHFKYIIELVENFWFDRDKMREVIMPSHAPVQQEQ